MERSSIQTLLLSLGIFLGLLSCGYFINVGIQRFNKQDRVISVKGFSEKEVKADFGVWTVELKVVSHKLSEANNQINVNTQTLISFLNKHNIADSEIFVRQLNVVDRTTDFYGNVEAMRNYRFYVEKKIQVRTTNVDILNKVSQLTGELLQAGLTIDRPAIRFSYTRLNDIKPAMLTEAIQNAQVSAAQFSEQSNVKLGALKKVTQGLFSIVDRDMAIKAGENSMGYYDNGTDLYKQIRVVINAEYAIE